jgi:abortive infection bacteriophage resistance protein
MITLLTSRGLTISDPTQAEHFLQRIGYYRLSGYTLLLETSGIYKAGPSGRNLYQRSHIFKTGLTFTDLVNLYNLDRELRLLILDAVERIEVAFRNEVSNHMALVYGAHWFMDKRNFDNKYTNPRRNGSNYDRLISDIEQKTFKNDTSKRNAFCDHYYEFYITPDLPASWMIAEQLSLGTWSIIYENLRQRKDQKAIARAFKTSAPKLISWLRALTHLRNLCAHHSRLLGVNFVQIPQLSSSLPNLKNSSFAMFAAVIHYLLYTVSPNASWATQLQNLFNEYSTVDIKKLLGFSNGWAQDKFWGF